MPPFIIVERNFHGCPHGPTIYKRVLARNSRNKGYIGLSLSMIVGSLLIIESTVSYTTVDKIAHELPLVPGKTVYPCAWKGTPATVPVGHRLEMTASPNSVLGALPGG